MNLRKKAAREMLVIFRDRMNVLEKNTANASSIVDFLMQDVHMIEDKRRLIEVGRLIETLAQCQFSLDWISGEIAKLERIAA